DGSTAPVDASQLTVGQFVDVELDPAQLPALVATEVEVKNFKNELEVMVEDEDGHEIDDNDTDVTVDVDENVREHQSMGASKASKNAKSRIRRVRRHVHMHHTGPGSFTIAGLPTGNARVEVTVNTPNGPRSGRGKAKIEPNQVNHATVHLKGQKPPTP